MFVILGFLSLATAFLIGYLCGYSNGLGDGEHIGIEKCNTFITAYDLWGKDSIYFKSIAYEIIPSIIKKEDA